MSRVTQWLAARHITSGAACAMARSAVRGPPERPFTAVAHYMVAIGDALGAAGQDDRLARRAARAVRGCCAHFGPVSSSQAR
jgi:hypothetical protein